jgi:hypothetical protein
VIDSLGDGGHERPSVGHRHDTVERGVEISTVTLSSRSQLCQQLRDSFDTLVARHPVVRHHQSRPSRRPDFVVDDRLGIRAPLQPLSAAPSYAAFQQSPSIFG